MLVGIFRKTDTQVAAVQDCEKGGSLEPACSCSLNHTLVTTCARGQIPRLSDGTGLDKAGGKATLCGYATEQTTKTSPKDP